MSQPWASPARLLALPQHYFVCWQSLYCGRDRPPCPRFHTKFWVKAQINIQNRMSKCVWLTYHNLRPQMSVLTSLMGPAAVLQLGPLWVKKVLFPHAELLLGTYCLWHKTGPHQHRSMPQLLLGPWQTHMDPVLGAPTKILWLWEKKYTYKWVVFVCTK